MRTTYSILLSLLLVHAPGVAGSSLTSRTDPTGDLCGEVNSVLKVPNKWLPGSYITIGNIDACLCVSDIPSFLYTNPFAITAVALAGQTVVTAALTDMIKQCPGEQCSYPPHSVPACAKGSACGFTCKDGYTPYPLGPRPTNCACNWPYTECNGKCGLFQGCPSQYKRDLNFGGRNKHCEWGHTACGIWGRNAHAWECVDIQNDLESCGGCMVSLNPGLPDADGVDCTAIPGVADVSCVRGACVVNRCMPGYDLNSSKSSCIYSEEKDPILLAAQYSIDHIPIF
ncbi:hypothetical protein BDQ17DRAFT_1353759 [Cyathus striatus]|nr:hypothetical protein BDQ17DRAFT_1353759 [Cyathus striatus]